MKEFLGQSNHIKVLSLNVLSAKLSFNLDEFRESSSSLPFEVEKLCVCVKNVPPSSVSALFDGIFAMCYFRTLSLRTDNKAVCGKFIEWVYEELKNGDASCCNSHSIKCWRHYLKCVNIESSVSANDQKPSDMYNFCGCLACP